MPLPTKSLYTLDEAESFILTETGKTVTRAQLLDWGSQGHYKLYLLTKECSIRIRGQPRSEVIAQNLKAELRLSSVEAAILGGSYFSKIKISACWIRGIEFNFFDVPTKRNSTFSLNASSLRLLGPELTAFTASIAEPQQTAPAADVATHAPVGATGASGGEAPWKEQARTRAYEIIKRDNEKDLYPSQENIADEIAKQFRREGLKGSDGKPLTGSYIKRHALKGISSAQSKLLLTGMHRGK